MTSGCFCCFLDDSENWMLSSPTNGFCCFFLIFVSALLTGAFDNKKNSDHQPYPLNTEVFSGWNTVSFPPLLSAHYNVSRSVCNPSFCWLLSWMALKQERVQLSFSVIKSGMSKTPIISALGKLKGCIHIPIFSQLHKNITHCRPQSLTVLRTILWWKLSIAAPSNRKI